MLTIEEMQIDDCEAVAALEEKVFSVPWSLNGFFTYLIRNDTAFFVAKEEDTVVGYAGMVMAADEADVTNVCVEEEKRGSGIGGKLVDALIGRAYENGVENIFLEVRSSNASAISLYERKGFCRIGIRKNYYDLPKEDAITMVKRRGE